MSEEQNKTNGQINWVGLGACVLSAYVAWYGGSHTSNNKDVSLIQKSKIEYVNNDTLPDLILGNGEIYLQKNDGGFVSYESFLEEQKTTLKDSIESKIEFLAKQRTNLDKNYQLKLDSINDLYKN